MNRSFESVLFTESVKRFKETVSETIKFESFGNSRTESFEGESVQNSLTQITENKRFTGMSGYLHTLTKLANPSHRLPAM